MLKIRSSSRTRPGRSYDQRICLVCAAARRAVRSPGLDPAVALGVSAEVELEGAVSNEFLQSVVSGFVRLTEEEALELLREVPHEAYLSDELGGSCLLLGACGFREVLVRQVAA